MKTTPLIELNRPGGRATILCQFTRWALLFLGAPLILAQPIITKQPANVSVSLGATAQFRVTASGSSPLAYLWRHQNEPIPGATNASLTLTNIQRLDAGSYVVAVTDATGTTNSNPATLEVDSTFTKITTGNIVTDVGHWHGATWGDYDNDGYPDLFIHQYGPTTKDILYRNNGDGTFTWLTTVIPQGLTLQNSAWGNAWGDYDNDGYLDLFISNYGGRNVLLHNRGDGTFERIASGPGAEGVDSTGAVWGDYDHDGYLDLFVANGYLGQSEARQWLYHNQGDGTFLRMSTNEVGSLASDRVKAAFGSWIDFDENGRLDLFLPTSSARAWFYCQQPGGGFVRTTNDANLTAMSFAWADYDNDGDLDLFVGTWGGPLMVYRNEGNGTFKKLTAAEVGSLVNDQTWGGGMDVGDYDNDGFLDLFVAGGWSNASTGVQRTKNCFLYHNNGNGTFTKITAGSPANESSESMAVKWVDYNRDGFLDLFVQDHGGASVAVNLLYQNNGNSNNWLCVNCVGTSSPRFGTGAKVRVKATLAGKALWQLRLIDAGGTCWGGQSLVAHFGLGNATIVDTLRIEWPSGIVQELHGLAPNQYLTFTEPVRVQMTQPRQLQIQCWKGMAYGVEASANLRDWRLLTLVTNAANILQWTDPDASSLSARFYRAIKQSP